MKRAVLIFASAIVSIAACSSSSSSGAFGSDGGSVSSDGGTGGSDSASGSDSAVSADATKACADAADAFCTQLQTCSSFGLQVGYGDLATCKTRFALGCAQTFSFPGTSSTPATTEACAAALPAISCSDFISQNLGSACTTQPGTVANGSPCGDDAQCSSTFCARAPDSQCGTCSAVSTAGGACANQSCSTGFACPTGGSTCLTPVAGQVNDACQAQSDCDVAHAVGCNTNNKKCIALAVAASGGSCGADSITPSKFTLCPANGSCDALLGGSCHATAADGAACSTASSGPNCLAPAKCVGSICKLPDATACH
ncbi:MAG: hypothetical protein ABI183_11795 [Polyangiaceae bacterium]